jgi:hypothetical protein
MPDFEALRVLFFIISTALVIGGSFALGVGIVWRLVKFAPVSLTVHIHNHVDEV